MESVCSYTLYDKNDPTISVDSSLEDEDVVSFTLPTDKRYFTCFKISNAGGTRNISGTNFSEIYMQYMCVMSDRCM